MWALVCPYFWVIAFNDTDNKDNYWILNIAEIILNEIFLIEKKVMSNNLLKLYLMEFF